MNIKNWFNFIKNKNLSGADLATAVKSLPKHLSKVDKIIIAVLSCAIVISIVFIWRNHWISTTNEVPAYGGTLNEGIVGAPKDLEKHLGRLTGAGLTKVQPTGEIKGDIAERWDVLDSGKTFQFKLRDGFNSGDLAAQLQAKNVWPNIEVATPADNLIAFKFKQPFSPFLYISTEPVFDYGPYKVAKEEKDKITLQAQDTYWQGKPYIDKIVFHFYANEDALTRAAQRREINGYLVNDQNESKSSDSRLMQMPLPRELLVFFNMSRDALKNKTLRQALRDNKSADKDYSFTLVTSDNEKNIKIAQNLQSKWAPLKVNITIKQYDNATLQKDIIPKRDYDILLYGLDYGEDPDPYPFWHSSQIGPNGMNLSNYSNKQADKLLEDARQIFDFKVRDDKYVAFRKILDEEVPYIKISQETCFYVLSGEVKGIDKIYGFNESDRFLNINTWYINTKRVKK